MKSQIHNHMPHRVSSVDLMIIGAGLSGLTTALHCNCDHLVIEKAACPGGLLRTENIDGFLFDCTGHWLHIREQQTADLINDLLKGKTTLISRSAAIYSNSVMTLYPFQSNLYGLPLNILRECIQGAVEAAIERAAGVMQPINNFEEYVNMHFGRGIARHFIIPYNTKLWGVPPSEVTAEWTQRFVPVPDIRQIIDGALGFSSQAMGYNISFMYPSEGGIESLIHALIDRLDSSRILLNTAPIAISATDKWIEFNGSKVYWKFLVSSAALPDLVALTVDVPNEIRTAASLLRCSKLRYINVGLDVPSPLEGKHWIYLPEDKYPFYRIGVFSNAVKSLAPDGKSSLYVELANDRQLSDDTIIIKLAEFLKEIRAIKSTEQMLFAEFREHPWGYVIFDKHYTTAREKILNWFNEKGIKSIGRFGAWTYNSMEDAILEAISTAHEVGKI